MLAWTNFEACGLLPDIIRPYSTESAEDQLNSRYAHGGGYHAFTGFQDLTGVGTVGGASMRYPGDPVYREMARCVTARGETCILFTSQFLAIVQDDGKTFTVTRVD